MAYISGSTLEEDIHEYRRNKAKNITVPRYVKAERIVEKAKNILEQYNTDEISVHISDQKLMAQYIDTFGFYNRENLLNKLQKESSFNVRKYLEDSKLTWWQKTFRIQPKKTDYMSAAQLQKQINAYKKLGKKLSRGFYHSEKEYTQQMRMEEAAVAYAAKFLHDDIKVTREDAPVLQKYWQIIGNSDKEPTTQKAMLKLQTMSAESFAEPVKTNRLTAWFKNIKQKFSPAKAKEIRMAPTPSTSRRRFGTRSRVAGFAVLLSIAGILGLKSDKSNASGNRNNHKTEQTAQPKKAAPDTKTFVMQPQQQELTAEQKIWQNFYTTKNTMLADMLKLDAASLQNTLQKQAQSGIFTMPQNVMSEQLVYTHLIYKAYGLPSPIEDILTAKEKISPTQQQNMEQAVNTAGQYGFGVKKIAQKQAQQSGRTLGHRSAFNQAPRHLKQAYITNLKQVRELHHR